MAFEKITEQSSLYENLDQMSASELLHNINAEDAKISGAVAKAIPQIEKLVSEVYPRLEKGGRLFYIGAGTSGRLGVLDASEIPPTFGLKDVIIGVIAGGDRALRVPVEGAEDDRSAAWSDLQRFSINENDTVLGIAASGTTPYVVGGLAAARQYGLLTASISSNVESPISKEVEIIIEVILGPEFVTGSSRMKSGTAQKMILNMISTSLMIKLGRVKGNKMVNMQLSNDKLIDRGTRMIVEELGLEYDLAKKMLLESGSVKRAIDEYNKQ